MAKEVKTTETVETPKHEAAPQAQEQAQTQAQPQSSTVIINNNVTQQNSNINQQPKRLGYALRTSRGMFKMIIFGILTLGIYPIVVEDHISDELNMLVTRYDGRRTMRFGWIFFIFSWLTFGIARIVWYHRTSSRMHFELRRRNIPYSFGAGTYWGWNILGSLIFIGPFIYLHKRMKAMNKINADCNVNGL